MHIWSNRNLPLLYPENFLSISNLEIASVSLENQTLCLEQDKLVESEATIICLNGLSDWVFFKIPLLALAMVIEVSKYDKNLLWHLMPGHNVVKFFMELHSFFIHILWQLGPSLYYVSKWTGWVSLENGHFCWLYLGSKWAKNVPM